MSSWHIRSDSQRLPGLGAADDKDSVQRWARPFIALLLTGFAFCGLFGFEAWPFSGFRLFSAPRPPTWSSFHVEVVRLDGTLERLHVASLPTRYRGFGVLAARLPSQSVPERLALCRVYANAAATDGTSIGELRIYREEHAVLPRARGVPTAPIERTLVASCVPGDAP